MTFNGQTVSQARVVVEKSNASGKFPRSTIEAWQFFVFNMFGSLEPAMLRIAAGEYGIVAIKADGKEHRAKSASGDVYEQPIAKFTVRAGEITNIGTLHIVDARAGQGFLGRGNGTFSVQVSGTIPQERLQNLAKREPPLRGPYVSRPMTVPGRNKV
jgi:hypothetical protein